MSRPTRFPANLVGRFYDLICRARRMAHETRNQILATAPCELNQALDVASALYHRPGPGAKARRRGPAAPDATLLSADFNIDANGFTTGRRLRHEPAELRQRHSGDHWRLRRHRRLAGDAGRRDGDAITGMSGGWSYTLEPGRGGDGGEAGVPLQAGSDGHVRLRRVYPRMLVKVDGVQYGRGAKNYVDHIGGDGSSSQGNSNTYLPTTDWQQHEVLRGQPGGGQPHDRAGRLQQQEGRRRTSPRRPRSTTWSSRAGTRRRSPPTH